jgi:dihydroflavonol-4-reductase
MKILITGATGLVGSALTRQLVDQGADVRILRRATSRLDLLGEAARQVEHATGDVTDPASVAAALAGVQQVYHTAGFLGFGGHRDRPQLHRVNVGGTAHVVNAALASGVERLVHTSSIAALGRPEQPQGPVDETAEWHSSRYNSHYAISKHLAELEVYRGIAEGLDAVLVNPSLVFGVGRPGENTRQIAEKVRDGAIPAVPVGGTNVVDVQDVAAGHLRAMERGETGERYILGSENLSWEAILHTLAAAFGTAPPQRTLPPALGQAIAWLTEGWAVLTRTRPLLTRETARNASLFYHYDNRKAVEALGCRFRPFEATARRLAAALGSPG